MEHRMRRWWLRTASLVPTWTFGFMLAAAELQAQQAHLAITPAHPLPGAIVRLKITDAGAASDTIVGVAGTMAGEPLHFVDKGGVWRAIGAVPVDSGGEVVAHAVFDHGHVREDPVERPGPIAQPLPLEEVAGEAARAERHDRPQPARRFPIRSIDPGKRRKVRTEPGSERCPYWERSRCKRCLRECWEPHRPSDGSDRR